MGIKSAILVFFKSTPRFLQVSRFFGSFFFVDSNKYRIFVAEKTIERN